MLFRPQDLPDGWEQVQAEIAHRAGKSSGERLVVRDPDRYEQVVNWLSQGLSYREIVKLSGWGYRSLKAVEDSEYQRIATRKESIASRCYRVASKSIDSYEQDLESGLVPAGTKVIAAGILIDKGQLLSGQATDIQEHRHSVIDPEQLREYIQSAVAGKPVSSPDVEGQKGDLIDLEPDQVDPDRWAPKPTPVDTQSSGLNPQTPNTQGVD
jgi:hypothetical protein